MSDSFAHYPQLFASPNGPNDARPTAMQVIDDSGLAGKWEGKVILITGATSGIGLEAARALHKTGADVFITARDAAKGQTAVEDILKETEGKGRVEAIEMELNSLESVKKAAQVFLSKSSKLHILINNAGKPWTFPR
jgi:NAD(P)-dependent dehydrogenase (short-subunit alcohol dehydrogenase family)